MDALLWAAKGAEAKAEIVQLEIEILAIMMVNGCDLVVNIMILIQLLGI